MVAVPAPVLVSMLNEAQRSNELLRKESQQRTQGMRDIVDAVNRHLNASDRMMTIAAREQGGDLFKGKVGPPLNEAPRWRQQLVPYSPEPPQTRNELHGLRAEITPPTHGMELQGVARSGFWQAPESHSALISHDSSKPSSKWDAFDIRVASWNLDGLDFKAGSSGDFDSISIISSLIHHCHPDVLVLTGLVSGAAARKITALLNLWSEGQDAASTWRQVICPGAHSGSHSDTAMLWNERRDIRTWDNDGFSSDHGIISGLFSLHSRPVLIVTTGHSKGPKDLSAAIDASAAGLLKSHHGLVGSIHVIVVGPFHQDPVRNLGDQYEPLMANEGYSQADQPNIFISKAPYGAKTITREVRVLQPISAADGRVGVSVRPPFLSGLVLMAEPMARKVRGVAGINSPGLVWGDIRVKEKVQEPPVKSSSLILDDDDLKCSKPSSYLEAAKTTTTVTKPASTIGLTGIRSTTSISSAAGLTKAGGSGLSSGLSSGLTKAGGAGLSGGLSGGLSKVGGVGLSSGLSKVGEAGLSSGLSKGGLESRW